jgi:hypothetical protein
MPRTLRIPAHFLTANTAAPPLVEISVVSSRNKGLFFVRKDGLNYIAATSNNPATLAADDFVLEEHTMGTTLFDAFTRALETPDNGIVFDQLLETSDGFQLRVRVPNPFPSFNPRSAVCAYAQTLHFFEVKIDSEVGVGS